MRILVVDDERGVRNTVRRMLVAAGHEVTTTDCNATALQAARSSAPDVLVTDLQMGPDSGLDLIRALRAESMPTPMRCVLMTGRQGHRMPADLSDVPVVFKPFDGAALLEAIDRAPWPPGTGSA